MPEACQHPSPIHRSLRACADENPLPLDKTMPHGDVRTLTDLITINPLGQHMIPDAYALEALRFLLPEFDFTDTNEVDLKITEQLKKKKLGAFDPVMISELRVFKNAVQTELHQASKSRYFTQTHGQCCDIRDFDLQMLATDMVDSFPSISRGVIDRFLPSATFYYYLK